MFSENGIKNIALEVSQELRQHEKMKNVLQKINQAIYLKVWKA